MKKISIFLVLLAWSLLTQAQNKEQIKYENYLKLIDFLDQNSINTTSKLGVIPTYKDHREGCLYTIQYSGNLLRDPKREYADFHHKAVGQNKEGIISWAHGTGTLKIARQPKEEKVVLNWIDDHQERYGTMVNLTDVSYAIKYEGKLAWGKKHGQGTETQFNKDGVPIQTIKGTWQAGALHGTDIEIERSNTGIVEKGEMHYGYRVGLLENTFPKHR